MICNNNSCGRRHNVDAVEASALLCTGVSTDVSGLRIGCVRKNKAVALYPKEIADWARAPVQPRGEGSGDPMSRGILYLRWIDMMSGRLPGKSLSTLRPIRSTPPKQESV